MPVCLPSKWRLNVLPFVQCVLAVLCLLQASQSHALLNLELTQGVKAALPVAFVHFSGESDLSREQQVSHVIENDLAHSGEFRLITGEALPATPHSIQQIQPSAWRHVGAEYIVVGSIKETAAGDYRVTTSLVNLYLNSDQDQVSQQAVLFSKVFTVKPAQLRQLSHKISNLIYQSLTGTRGVFSTKLAYVVVTQANHTNHYRLMVSDYDGEHRKELIASNQPIMSPSWSPDGRLIAFVSFQQVFPAIYTVDVATGKLTQITKLRGINGAPAWSSDGSSIAYVSSPTGQAKIYLKELGSGRVTQLTHGYAIDTEPSFSPDGNSLFFTSNRGGGPQIYRYDRATKHIERVTYEGDYNARASIASNGRDMVVLHREHRQYFIAMQDLDTGHLRLLTKSGMAESPSLSPNGKMIIYTTKTNGKTGLAMVSSDGQVQIALPESEGRAQEPAWSPF